MGCQSVKVVGLSPRWRGNQEADVDDVADYGSIPALAGQPGSNTGMKHFHGVYPRAGGATCIATVGQSALAGLSPRWRGNRRNIR